MNHRWTIAHRGSSSARSRSGGRAALAILVALFASACRGETGRPSDDEGTLAAVRFEDVTARAGIARQSPTYDAAIGDMDGDSLPDVYVGNHATGAVLLHNQGDGTFRDILPGSGIEPRGDQHGAGFGDFDNDGKLDLYVSVGARRGLTAKANRLYRNVGAGRFEDRATTAGVPDPNGRSRSLAWLDVNRDGWLDLVLANFASPSRLYLNRGDGTFEDASERFGLAELSATRISWTDYDGDGYPDLLLSGTPRGLRLLRNESGQRFRDVTRAAGLEPMPEPVQGMAFGDYDNDGDLDLALSHGADFSEGIVEQPSGTLRFAFFAHDEPVGFDFETEGGSTAVEAELLENGSPVALDRVRCGAGPVASARVVCNASAAASPAPPDENPRFQLWRDPAAEQPCDGCESRQRWHLRWQGKGDHHLSGLVYGATKAVPVGLRTELHRGAALWLNEGGFFVRDLDSRRGLPPEAAVNGQAVQWADVDSDGWLDLYLVDSGVDGGTSRNVLLLNDAGWRFVLAPHTAGATPESGPGRGVGAHFFDFDRDGRLDLFLTNGWGAPPFDRGPYKLLRNVGSGGHWLAVTLGGAASNRDGLGAWLAVEGCGETIVRHHNGGPSYFSQSVTPVHFGLGTCGDARTLHVRWPSGAMQVVQNIHIDRFVHVEEPE